MTTTLNWKQTGEAEWSVESAYRFEDCRYVWRISVTKDGLFTVKTSSKRLLPQNPNLVSDTLIEAKVWVEAREKELIEFAQVKASNTNQVSQFCATRSSSGVWMSDTQPHISVSRLIAVDTMEAMGESPDNFRLRDKLIVAICERVDGTLDAVTNQPRTAGGGK